MFHKLVRELASNRGLRGPAGASSSRNGLDREGFDEDTVVPLFCFLFDVEV